jgi:predicted phosphodiesterase
VKRVAALYDIHGNLPALEAVLEDVQRSGVECIVIGGDVVPGPMPRETLTCLSALELPVHFIQGNGEVAVLKELAGEKPAVPAELRKTLRWVAQQLGPADKEWLASWAKTLTVEMPSLGEVLFCHAAPRDENEMFTRFTPENHLAPMFDGIEAAIVVCGHTHMQFDRMIGMVRVINAGSVGMPYGEPGAYWLLLGPGVELRRTLYNLEQTAKRIRSTDYPEAESFAAHNVLQPPSEEHMLEICKRAESRARPERPER